MEKVTNKWVVLGLICLIVSDIVRFYNGDITSGIAGLGTVFIILDRLPK